MNLGYQFVLDNNIISEDLGETIKLDTSSNLCLTEFAASNEFTIPTYVKTKVKFIEDMYITEPRTYRVGNKKLTASFLPANAIVRMTYSNTSPTVTKDLIVSVDYMY